MRYHSEPYRIRQKETAWTRDGDIFYKVAHGFHRKDGGIRCPRRDWSENNNQDQPVEIRKSNNPQSGPVPPDQESRFSRDFSIDALFCGFPIAEAGFALLD